MNRCTIYRFATIAVTTVAAVAAAGPAYAAEPQILAANSLPVIVSNITTWIIGILVGVATTRWPSSRRSCS